MGSNPTLGLEILEGTKLAEHVIPELPALQLEIDEHHKHKDVYEHSLIVLQQAIDLETTHEPTCEPDLSASSSCPYYTISASQKLVDLNQVVELAFIIMKLLVQKSLAND
jgi:hypothetical protein